MSSSEKTRAAAPKDTSPSGVPDATPPVPSTAPAPAGQGAAAPAPAPRGAPDAEGGAAPGPQPEAGGAANEQLHHIQELRTLLVQALANNGAAPEDSGQGAPSATDAVSTLKRLSLPRPTDQLATRRRGRPPLDSGGATQSFARLVKQPSIFSMDAPTSAATTQGKIFADGGTPQLDNDCFASLATNHFSPENAAMMKALLQIKTLSTEAVTTVTPPLAL